MKELRGTVMNRNTRSLELCKKKIKLEMSNVKV